MYGHVCEPRIVISILSKAVKKNVFLSESEGRKSYEKIIRSVKKRPRTRLYLIFIIYYNFTNENGPRIHCMYGEEKSLSKQYLHHIIAQISAYVLNYLIMSLTGDQ